MRSRLKVLVVSGALVAALGISAAVHADEVPAPDQATAEAIVTLRTNALALVPVAFHDAVAASYSDDAVSLDASVITARKTAEQTAFAALDPESRFLINSYYSSVQFALFGETGGDGD